MKISAGKYDLYDPVKRLIFDNCFDVLRAREGIDASRSSDDRYST